MRQGLVVLGVLVLTSLACSTLLGPVVDQVVPPDLSGSSGDGDGDGGGESGGSVLLQDDFGDPSTGWEVGSYDTGTVGYEAGKYRVDSFGDGDTMWGIANRDFDDTVIEVSAEQVSAPPNDNNDYGVICRVQDNSDGYFLLISGDGFYTILKRSNETFDPLIDWTPTDVIRPGNAVNELRATCSGSTLTLEVNGQLLGSTSDSEFSHGDLALTATSYEPESTQINFDNLLVTRP
jgi:hypothetical protein